MCQNIKRVRDIENTMKRLNIYVIGVPRGNERTNKQRQYSKNNACWNFSKLMKYMNPGIQENQKS